MDSAEDSTDFAVALLLSNLALVRLGTLLRTARLRRLQTRREVAKHVDASARMLRRFERGSVPITPDCLTDLLAYYGDDLTTLFAPRQTFRVQPARIAIGAEAAELSAGDGDEVVGAYVRMLARVHDEEIPHPVPLGLGDMGVLSNALGVDDERVEARVSEILERTASLRRRESLRRKGLVGSAGFVMTLAVVAGFAVGASVAAKPGGAAGAGPTTVSKPASSATAAPVSSTTHESSPPTTTAVPPTTTTSSPSVPAPPVAVPPAAPVTAPPPPPPTPTTAIGTAVTAVLPSTTVPRPVITTDTTPISLPPNEPPVSIITSP